jgi:hypothetical protein
MRTSSILLIVGVLIFILVAYGEKTGTSNGTQQQITSTINMVKPLEEKDFTVTDGVDIIRLDTPFKNFQSQKVEKRFHFVGWISSGNFNYKYNIHMYEDFNIYTSNANYNLKNRNFDDRYITQIMLTNAVFKTLQGISIGSALQEVISLYGEGRMQKNNDSVVVEYLLKDMALQFTIDKEQKVTGITLLVLVKNADKS